MSGIELIKSASLRLTAIPPYDFLLTVRKPAGWDLFTPSEVFEDGTLWTAMRMEPCKMVGLKLRSTGTVERPEILCQAFTREELTADERRSLENAMIWALSLDEDLREFYALAERDPLVETLARDLYGMRRTRRPDVFPLLILAVTLQMAPIRRSNQMRNLLISEYGEKVAFDRKEILYWPSPETIAKAEVRELEKRCKLGYRAAALRGIAETVSQGFPSLRELGEMLREEARARLMQLKGIGEYSAEIVSPHPGFALDIWSAKIFSLLLLGEEAKSPRGVIAELKQVARGRWGKWDSYVFFYVLHDLRNLSRRFNLNLTEL